MHSTLDGKSPALAVTGVSHSYGKRQALADVTFAIAPASFTVLLGLNGAGKTSLLAAIAGTLPLAGGSVLLGGTDLTSRPSWTRSARGIVLVPAGRQLFGELSVLDNLLVGGHAERSRKARAERVEAVFEYFPMLRDKRHQRARELSGGQQQMVAFGRGLMASPRALLLDEPSEGLAPIMVETMFEAIQTMRRAGNMAILLAEQNAGIAEVCDSVLVMRDGVISESVQSAEVTDIAGSVFG